VLFESTIELYSIVEQLFNDFDTANFLAVNQHNDIWYYNKEQFETLMQWVLMLQFIYAQKDRDAGKKEIALLQKTLEKVHDASILSEYKIETLKELLLSTPKLKKTTKKITQRGNKETKQIKKKQTSGTKTTRLKKKRT
jgi:hypothetical protein